MSQSPQIPPLPEALNAQRAELRTAQAGRIAYYHDPAGEGRPLVLVHSINAAPSSYEVKPIFEHYAGHRPVYSIELPGFGHSERADRPYSAELYANAIRVLLEDVVQAPADLLALSLSTEFAARAALGSPASVASLVLISPTGFSRRPLPPMGLGRGLHGVLGAPLWSQGLYDLVASKRSIRYYLGKSFRGQPPQAFLDYAYATSHQPGARYAPLIFLSTQLFTRNAVDKLYARLTKLPVLAIADRDPYVTFEELDDLVSRQPNWQHETLAPHLGLPQWEQPEALFDALDRFWTGV
ncbi:alpha/beta hydrolase [Lamprobacter modestohalophilus]|uniref:Alpha/beta hydrolase n=1 Tax=Lamprobacter modestohalophilus TaxID=1064514 RepID=A0A9X0W556_9GAMM|nr:alpha/beta hydrolase [Lamprobacter modestohalophilus]MBK1617065.1 alpha/beta hydrolase [Lamprobacter modestohalophilus]